MSNQVTPFRDLKIDDIRKLIDEGYEVVDVAIFLGRATWS
jgi:hypothetical protein